MGKDIAENNDNSPLLKSLSRMLARYHGFLNDHDIENVLDMIHDRSPAKASIRRMLEQTFSTYRLKNTLLCAKYIGIDNDYVYVRILERIAKLEGPEFRDNVADSLVVIKWVEDAWKVCSITPLEVLFL